MEETADAGRAGYGNVSDPMASEAALDIQSRQPLWHDEAAGPLDDVAEPPDAYESYEAYNETDSTDAYNETDSTDAYDETDSMDAYDEQMGQTAAVRSRGALATWLQLARPLTLPLSLFAVLAPLALLYAQGEQFSWLLALCAFVAVGLAHMGANLLDEYLEYVRSSTSWLHAFDHDPATRPLLADAAIHPLDVLRASVVLLVMGALAGVPLALVGGPVVAGLGLLGLLISFLYSATSIAFKRLPLGDLAALLTLGPGIALVTVLAQRKPFTLSLLLLSLALGCFALAVTEIARLRDPRGDAANGYHTLVTLLGERAARTLCGLALLAAFALVFVVALPTDGPHGALLVIVALPAALLTFVGATHAAHPFTRRQMFHEALWAYVQFAGSLTLGLLLTGAILQIATLYFS
ncbi:MAG: prenyltransferase [Ktedonobacterales bacterium]